MNKDITSGSNTQNMTVIDSQGSQVSQVTHDADPKQVNITPVPSVIVPPKPSGIVYMGRDPSIMSMDDALNKAFDLYGMPRLGGASGRGWSRISTMQRCMYLYKRRYLDGERGHPSAALEIGSAFHTLMALHYRGMREPDLKITPERLHRELIELGADMHNINESWRIYEAYVAYYGDSDYLIPMAEEEFAGEPDGNNTCRYDMIARVEPGDHTIPPGTWLIEHKTSSRFDTAMLQSWRNDGEIIGQIMIWKAAKLTRKYGKLRGVIVNIVGKQKIPKFERVIVPVQAWQTRTHKKDLQIWNAFEQLCSATNTWPRSRTHCTTKYGPCSMFDACAENKK